MNRTGRVKLTQSLDEPRSGITVRVGNREWMIPSPNNHEETEANGQTALPRHGAERDEPVTAGEPAWSKKVPPSLLRPVDDVLSPATDLNAHGAQRLSKAAVHPSLTRARRHRARRIRETFQFGCIFGLLLGCLSMILFHQMEPNLSSDAPSTASDSVVLSTSVHSFDLPAVKVEILQSKPLGNRSEADRQAASLNQRGVPAVVHQQGKQIVIWTAVAIKAGHLQKWASTSASNGVATQAVPLNLSVQSVPALSGSNPKSLAEVSNWLSLSATALRTLTAVESDGGLPEDAYTAYDTARQQLPGADVLAETGKGDLLKQFSRELDAAFAAYRKQQAPEAMRHTLLAYDLLSRLHL